MSEDKLANINGEELRKEIEILFEDKEKSVFHADVGNKCQGDKRVAERGDFGAGIPGNITESRVQNENM